MNYQEEGNNYFPPFFIFIKKRSLIRFVVSLLLCFIAQVAMAQKLYRGIVVDSASLINLPDAHVLVKRSTKATATDFNGNFLINATPTDTLIISAIGYHPMELPLLFHDDAILIMLRENKIMLSEVVIKSTRLYPNKIIDRTKTAPRTMTAMEGAFAPFDYFWKLEREKRKLSRVVEENNKTQTFRQVITDPDVREIMKKEYELTDESYYNLLVEFNRLHRTVHYYTDADGIMEELHRFFEFHCAKK